MVKSWALIWDYSSLNDPKSNQNLKIFIITHLPMDYWRKLTHYCLYLYSYRRLAASDIRITRNKSLDNSNGIRSGSSPGGCLPQMPSIHHERAGERKQRCLSAWVRLGVRQRWKGGGRGREVIKSCIRFFFLSFLQSKHLNKIYFPNYFSFYDTVQGSNGPFITHQNEAREF